MNGMEMLQAMRLGCEAFGLRPEDFRGLGATGQERVIAAGWSIMKEKEKERVRHVEVSAVSGEVTCACGFATGHYAMMSDADEVFDAHRADPELTREAIVAAVFTEDDE